MLSPDTRTVAMDLLRPPAGYRLESAMLTTYSLDLEALLALPLAVLAQSDDGLEELLTDPLLLLEALREARDRVHVFVDEGSIAVPRSARPLYALLEKSVHPVRAPNGGAFHPKVWVARFDGDDGATLLRVAVLSRNLTFDRSWDVALASEAAPAGKRRHAASKPLAELLEALPDLATEPLPDGVADALYALSADVARTSFPSPEGFHEDAIAFHVLGLSKRNRWPPRHEASQLFAVAPFLSKTALEKLAQLATGNRTLVSRQEELDALPADTLEAWDQTFVLSDTVAAEPEEEEHLRPSGLHAKLFAVEHGRDVTWYTGSANFSHSAFDGPNVELVASVAGRKGRQGGRTGVGIERFKESGFMRMCAPYRRIESEGEDAAVTEARRRIESARDRLVGSDLRIACSTDAGSWTWSLDGELDLPGGVEFEAWPVSVDESQKRPLTLPSVWTLPTARLTSFVAFRLRVETPGVDDIRLVLKMPARGMPQDRMAHVLRTLVDSPERFLRFLRALLGGLDGVVDWASGAGNGAASAPWSAGLGGETLLEDLVRVVSREPERLEPIRRLIGELRSTKEGSSIVPEDFLTIWNAVEAAVAARKADGAS